MFSCILSPRKKLKTTPLQNTQQLHFALCIRWGFAPTLLLGYLCLMLRGLSLSSLPKASRVLNTGWAESTSEYEIKTILPWGIKLHQNDVCIIYNFIKVIFGQHKCDFWWGRPVGLGDLFDLGNNF